LAMASDAPEGAQESFEERAFKRDKLKMNSLKLPGRFSPLTAMAWYFFD
jgi:hypothetical protein